MFINDFLEKNADINFNSVYLKDSITFRVHEYFHGYMLSEIEKENKHWGKDTMKLVDFSIPSPLPYLNTTLLFDDGFLWMIGFTSEYLSEIGLQGDIAGYNLIIFGINKVQFNRGIHIKFKKAIEGTLEAYSSVGHVYPDSSIKEIEKDGEEMASAQSQKAMYLLVIRKYLEFLSCKNVRTREIQPADKLQKKRRKKGKKPLKSYHILELSNTVTLSSGSGNKDPQWSNRVHLCRGHMAEYGSKYGKGKLFGKIEGRFWIPPHVRGNKKEGILEKDYLLSAETSDD
jgi:hypothetical protein